MSNNLIDLIILRHGEAGSAVYDRERQLTERGRQQINSQYQWLDDHGFKPELILHSPYQRTVESAALAENYFPEAVYQAEPLITPDGNPSMVHSLITALDNHRILLVSHMPMVAYLTAEIVPEADIFGFPVAGLCWLQLDNDASSAKILHKRWNIS